MEGGINAWHGLVAEGTPQELRLSVTDPHIRNFLFREDAPVGKG